MMRLLFATAIGLTLSGCFHGSSEPSPQSFDGDPGTYEQTHTQERSWWKRLFWEDPNAPSYNSHGHSRAPPASQDVGR